jgi:hypothetical protein
VPELKAEDFEALGIYNRGAARAAQRVALLRYLVGLGATADVVGRGRRRRFKARAGQHRPPDTAVARGGALPLPDATHAGSLAGSGCEQWGELDDAGFAGVPPRAACGAACTLSDVQGGRVALVDRVFGARVAMHPRVRSAQTPWRN